MSFVKVTVAIQSRGDEGMVNVTLAREVGMVEDNPAAVSEVAAEAATRAIAACHFTAPGVAAASRTVMAFGPNAARDCGCGPVPHPCNNVACPRAGLG